MNDGMNVYDSLLYAVDHAFAERDGFYIGTRRLMGIFQTGKRAKIKKELKVGARLELAREMNNKYDSLAVSVKEPLLGHIGYIEKGYNRDIAFVMDGGEYCYAKVSFIDGSSSTPGVLLDVYCTADRERLVRIKEDYKRHLERLAVEEAK